MRQLARKMAGDRDSRLAVAAMGTALVLKVAAAGCTFLFTLLIARRYGVEGSGIVALAVTLMNIATIFGGLGLDMTAMRSVVRDATRKDWSSLKAGLLSSTVLTLVFGGLVAFGISATAPWSAAALGGKPELEAMIRVLGLVALPLMFARLFAAALRGLHRFVQASTVDPFLSPALLLLLLLALSNSMLEEVALFYGIAAMISAGLGGLLLLRAVRSHSEPRGALEFRRVLAASLPIFGTMIGGFATPWVVVLAVGYFGGAAEAGIYRVAFQCAILLGFILQSAETGLAPQVAARAARGELAELGPAARRMSLILLVAGVLPGLALFAVAGPLLALFGPDFAAGLVPLRILIGAQIILMLLGPVGQVLIMSGLDRYSLANSTAGAVLVIILGLALVPTHGALGGAVAAGVTLVTRAIVATAIVWWKLGIFLPTGSVRGHRR